MTDGRNRRDVVVLGGGIAGLSLAWELARHGRDVVVLRSEHPAASPMAAGMLAPMPEIAINPGLGRLAVEALRYYPSFLEALGGDTDAPTGFVRSGLFRAAYDAGEVETLRESVGAYEAAGMPSRWLNAAAAETEVPGLGADGLAGGLLSYDEAQVQPAWLLAALEDALRRRGTGFQDAEAKSLVPAGAGAAVALADGGVIEADRVVLAMGSWSGVLPGVDLAVRPVKGQLLTFAAGAPGPERILYWGHDYVLTKADGTVVVGATMEEAGFSMETDERAEALRQVAVRLWPQLAEAPAKARAGLRPAAIDGLPVIGVLAAMPSVYVFSAHFRNGFLLGPLTARLAREEILGVRESDLLLPMRPGRLPTGAVTAHRGPVTDP